MDAQQARLDNEEAAFDEAESAIRQKATQRDQLKARQLRKLSTYLYDRTVNANDFKVVFDPVEYLVFHGLTKGHCTLIELVDHPAEYMRRGKVRKSIDRAVAAGNLEWQTFRVQSDGSIIQQR